MQTTLFRTGRITLGLALCLGLAPAALAQTQSPSTSVYGPKLKPALFDPQDETRDDQQRIPRPLDKVFKQLTPYEQSVSDWKGRQYSCMKKGSLCFENRPLPSDLLSAPSAR